MTALYKLLRSVSIISFKWYGATVCLEVFGLQGKPAAIKILSRYWHDCLVSPMLIVSLSTGLRFEELVGLTIDNFNAKAGRIAIAQQLNYKKVPEYFPHELYAKHCAPSGLNTFGIFGFWEYI